MVNDLPLPEPDEKTYRAGRDRLMRAFDDVRVDCTWVDGPFGRVFLAGGARGLRRVALRRDEQGFLDELENERLMPRLARDGLEDVRRELEEYFAGHRREFAMPIDLEGITAFQRQVLDAASAIPFGKIATYGEIARRIERPGASRAVGNALGANPVAIVVPCHRVVATGGGLGGYTGGLDIKLSLMRIEGIAMVG